MKAAVSKPDLCCPLKSKQEKSTAAASSSLADSEIKAHRRIRKAAIHFKLTNHSIYLWCHGVGVHLFLFWTSALQRLVCIISPKAPDYRRVEVHCVCVWLWLCMNWFVLTFERLKRWDDQLWRRHQFFLSSLQLCSKTGSRVRESGAAGSGRGS